MDDYSEEIEELNSSDSRCRELDIWLEFADSPDMIEVSFGDKHGNYTLRTIHISDLTTYLDGFEDHIDMIKRKRNNKGLDERIY